MKIGIDLSPLQMDHRFRGIGSVMVNFINNLDKKDKHDNQFVFFVEPKDENLAFELLKLDDISYKVEYLHNTGFHHLPGPLDIISKAFYKLVGFIQYYTGDPRISKDIMNGIDTFIQFDQNKKLPKKARRKAALFLHDLIPYIMESDYLWSYSTARLNGRSRKGSVKFAFQRYQYIQRVKISTRRAKVLIANSHHTKKDFIKYIHTNPNKIHVAQLGINPPAKSKKELTPQFYSFQTTMWGVVKEEFNPNEKPYILFIGGTDHRRKMVELIAAFNNLRARGVDISLVISGDSVEGVTDIKNPAMKKYLENNTSYINDIHLLGYVGNDQRDWLYKNALAFVFPSVYEGFGLPVIEAMSYGTPVITYKNTSIAEVAGDNVLYANDFLDIADCVKKLLDDPSYGSKLSHKGIERSQQFTWDKTKSAILHAIGA
jgi:glycosyltransferase involved in cell wall biosynthesis